MEEVPTVTIVGLVFGGEVENGALLVTESNGQNSFSTWCKEVKHELFELPLPLEDLEEFVKGYARRINKTYDPKTHFLATMTANKINLQKNPAKKAIIRKECKAIDESGFNCEDYEDVCVTIAVFEKDGVGGGAKKSGADTSGAKLRKTLLLKNTITSLYDQAKNLLDTGKSLSSFPLKGISRLKLPNSVKLKKSLLRSLFDIVQSHFEGIVDSLPPSLSALQLQERIDEYIDYLDDDDSTLPMEIQQIMPSFNGGGSIKSKKTKSLYHGSDEGSRTTNVINNNFDPGSDFSIVPTRRGGNNIDAARFNTASAKKRDLWMEDEDDEFEDNYEIRQPRKREKKSATATAHSLDYKTKAVNNNTIKKEDELTINVTAEEEEGGDDELKVLFSQFLKYYNQSNFGRKPKNQHSFEGDTMIDCKNDDVGGVSKNDDLSSRNDDTLAADEAILTLANLSSSSSNFVPRIHK